MPIDDRSLINTHVARVEVQSEQVTRLRDAPVEWSRQHAMLGLTH
jgi:hypothetical protein